MISNYSSVVPLQKPLPSTSTSRPKARPIARPIARMAAASSSSIDNNDIVTPSIADTAKMRKRNSTIQPSTEIIELTDDEDELALRPSPKAKAKPPKKTKIQKQRKPNPLRLGSADPDPPSLLSSSLPVPTIHGGSSQLPPSDPPQSTPFNDEFEMPPIVTLSNPASSASMGIDMGPPPPPFFAPDSSSSLPRAAVTPSTPDAAMNDSVNPKPKGRKSKKVNSDDEDFEPGMGTKPKGKGKKAAKGKDKAQVSRFDSMLNIGH